RCVVPSSSASCRCLPSPSTRFPYPPLFRSATAPPLTSTALCNRPRFHRTLQQAPVSPHFATRLAFTALSAAPGFHCTLCRARVSPHFLPAASPRAEGAVPQAT